MQTREQARIGSRLAAATIAAAVAALALIAPAAGQQERITIRGTSVTLTPPPGFTASRSVRGIENTATGSTITISEHRHEAYAELAERFSSPKSRHRRLRRAEDHDPLRAAHRRQDPVRDRPANDERQGRREVLRAAPGRQDRAPDIHDRRPRASPRRTPKPSCARSSSRRSPRSRSGSPSCRSRSAPSSRTPWTDIIPRQAVTLEVGGRPRRNPSS